MSDVEEGQVWKFGGRRIKIESVREASEYAAHDINIWYMTYLGKKTNTNAETLVENGELLDRNTLGGQQGTHA